jgi:hypothetical protein
MSAKSILTTGNTTFLNQVYNGTSPLTTPNLTIGAAASGPVFLTNPDPGVLQVSGSLAPSDIQDNSGSIGTPGQVLAKAPTGTDMLWTTLGEIFTNISDGDVITITPTNTTGTATLATIPYGVNGDIIYTFGTYLFTYTVKEYGIAGAVASESVQLSIVPVITSGANPIAAITGTVLTYSCDGSSLTASQVVRFTASQFGSLNINLTFTIAAQDEDDAVLTVEGGDFTLSYVQLS